MGTHRDPSTVDCWSPRSVGPPSPTKNQLQLRTLGALRARPHPGPLPEYRAREQLPRAFALGVLFGTLSFLLAGCSGGGSFEFASLDMTKIDPPPPRVQRVPMDRAYWWVDTEDGSLRVAMERNAPSLLGEIGRMLVRMSLRLEKPPAGASRQYAIRSGEFRGRVRAGASETRMTSAFGTAVIDRIDGNRIHGAVRLTANRQILQLLGGWGAASRTLVLGEFDAVPAKADGWSIYADTESNDFTRPPLRPPTSRPASAIASKQSN